MGIHGTAAMQAAQELHHLSGFNSPRQGMPTKIASVTCTFPTDAAEGPGRAKYVELFWNSLLIIFKLHFSYFAFEILPQYPFTSRVASLSS